MSRIGEFFKKIFKKKKYDKNKLISVRLEDGSEVPIVPNDQLELVKDEHGVFEIKIKEDNG